MTKWIVYPHTVDLLAAQDKSRDWTQGQKLPDYCTGQGNARQARVLADNVLKIPCVNPHTFAGKRLTAQDTFEAAITDITSDLGLEEWRYGRIDIALDNAEPWEQNIKKAYYLAALYQVMRCRTNRNIGEYVEAGRCYQLGFKSKWFEFSAYDKRKIDEFSQLPTHLEFRFKDEQNLSNAVQELKNYIKALNAPENVDAVEDQMLAHLETLYQEESAKAGVSLPLAVFLRNIANRYVLTKEIARRFYEGHSTGQFKHWWHEYGKDLAVVKPSELKTLTADLIHALQDFEKGNDLGNTPPQK